MTGSDPTIILKDFGVVQEIVEQPKSPPTTLSQVPSTVIELIEQPKAAQIITSNIGPAGRGSTAVANAGGPIARNHLLVIINGLLYHADPLDANHAMYIIGLSLVGGIAGTPIEFATAGEVKDTLGTWIQGSVYHAGVAGALSTSALVVGARWRRRIAVAESSDQLILSFGPTILTG